MCKTYTPSLCSPIPLQSNLDEVFVGLLPRQMIIYRRGLYLKLKIVDRVENIRRHVDKGRIPVVIFEDYRSLSIVCEVAQSCASFSCSSTRGGTNLLQERQMQIILGQ